MKRKIYLSAILFTLLIYAACKQAFEPNVKSAVTNYLVVDGFVNPGSDSTTISLSRSVPLGQKQTVKVEMGASVSVESSTGIFYNLKETKPGQYRSAGLNLPLTATYRLNIKTSNGKVYQSDFVPAKITPPVDSVTYRRTVDGLQIEASAHDGSNQTIYYRFTYEEAWKYHAGRYSFYEFFPNPPPKSPPINDRKNFFYYCYRGENSTRIILGSTAKLAGDVLSKSPVNFIENRSEKISEKYSINVKECALTKEGYEFWDSQRKNTEQLGGIFDPQPSELKSNIRCVTNPAETVIGFVSVCTETQKRIFIEPNQVNWEQPRNDHCANLDTILYAGPKNVVTYLYTTPGKKALLIPVDKIVDGKDNILGFLSAEEECVDCRLAGGTLTPPLFWK